MLPFVVIKTETNVQTGFNDSPLNEAISKFEESKGNEEVEPFARLEKYPDFLSAVLTAVEQRKPIVWETTGVNLYGEIVSTHTLMLCFVFRDGVFQFATKWEDLTDGMTHCVCITNALGDWILGYDKE